MPFLQSRIHAFFCLLTLVTAAQPQSNPNTQAAEIAHKSPAVQSAYQYLQAQAKSIQDTNLRKETLDAIANPDTCIRHRARLTSADKKRILHELVSAGLLDESNIMEAGVFPPVLNDGGDCPRLPQSFQSAPGSNFGSHHSYPGGLAIHEAFNEASALSLARDYRERYLAGPVDGANFIDQDLIIAAPIWHDWAKTLVFQWNADGTETAELNFGGPGGLKTGAHHILGLAETMKRGLSPALVITQASAHAAPTLGNEARVVSWLRAAAMIAGIDPVQKGYLESDGHGQFSLPALQKTKTAPNPANALRIEYTIHNLSDADYVYSIPAEQSADSILRQLAPQFGFSYSDTANYNLRYRNPVLSYMTAERILLIYNSQRLEGVKREIEKNRNTGKP